MNTNVARMLEPSRGSLAIRGIASVLFGIVAFMRPGITVLALTFVFGAYAFVDGVSAIAIAVHRWPLLLHRRLLVLDGLFGIGAGIITLLWPGITLLALILVMGIRFLVMGAVQIVDGFRLRDEEVGTRVLVGLGGLAGVALGVLTLVLPHVTALVLVTLLGIYAFMFGIVMLVLSMRVRSIPVAHPMAPAPA